MSAPGHPLQPGERAPDFTLPAADRDGRVALGDYLGHSALLLGLFRGLYCPFCRRAIANLGRLRESLAALEVQMLGVIATSPQNSRAYFKYHAAPMRLGADPDLTTHAAYGLPRPTESWEVIGATRINPTGELSEPLPIWEATKALAQLDLFKPTQIDRDGMQQTWNQLSGLFLIDRAGIVRWHYVEAADGLSGIGKYPPNSELVATVSAVLGGLAQKKAQGS